MDDKAEDITRRAVLHGAALAGLSALMKGCSQLNLSSDDIVVTDPGNPDCVLTPEQTEGPYYLDPSMVRSDITEGKEGVPLKLSVTVVQAETCAPIPNAVVDIWHADALGVYSGYQSEGSAGERFLRGSQVTDADGQAQFVTVYPGWYTGRTVHIHAKVHLDADNEVTTQFYFADDLSDAVYASNAPYDSRGARDTRNAQDGIIPSGQAVFLRVEDDGEGGYNGSIIIGVA